MNTHRMENWIASAAARNGKWSALAGDGLESTEPVRSQDLGLGRRNAAGEDLELIRQRQLGPLLRGAEGSTVCPCRVRSADCRPCRADLT